MELNMHEDFYIDPRYPVNTDEFVDDLVRYFFLYNGVQPPLDDIYYPAACPNNIRRAVLDTIWTVGSDYWETWYYGVVVNYLDVPRPSFEYLASRLNLFLSRGTELEHIEWYRRYFRLLVKACVMCRLFLEEQSPEGVRATIYSLKMILRRHRPDINAFVVLNSYSIAIVEYLISVRLVLRFRQQNFQFL